ncbi:MAG: 16S rRNA (guanine(966)-N(2))-methyltransferase RsmD [Nitrospinae bacterium]|nr:16S rRNA (guanine(966)-N(2))-methyltransferase RsmD [Nitrospinota bacterium]
MRIIAGRFKGAFLFSPRGMDVRPTPDKVRGAIFNIIGSDIEGAGFLDLFGGTGAVGLEALSRGAAQVTIVDNSTAELVRKNADKLKANTGITVRKQDAFSAMAAFAARGMKFDFIFADPPWQAGLEERIVDSAANILAPGGIFILEANKKTAVPIAGSGHSIQLAQTRKYGDAQLCFYMRAGGE